ncbi:MAG: hypothetical protein AAB037_06960 [Chloroflexota bacterium]
MILEALVIELLRESMLSSTKLTYAQLARLVEAHSEYAGASKGKSLERRIKNILKDERVLEQLRENTPENNISLGFKIGRLEIKGKFKLD